MCRRCNSRRAGCNNDLVQLTDDSRVLRVKEEGAEGKQQENGSANLREQTHKSFRDVCSSLVAQLAVVTLSQQLGFESRHPGKYCI